VFAYQPFTAHTLRSNPKDPLVKYFIDFSGREAGSIISRKVLGARGVARLLRSRPIHDLYEQLLETGHKGGSFAPRLCSLLLELRMRKMPPRLRRLTAEPGRVLSAAREKCESISAPFSRSRSSPP
jgi:AraC family transcriptional regulator